MAMTYYRRPITRRMNISAPVDIIETEDHYVVLADVPGFEKDEIDIEADFESLRFTAKKEINEDEEQPNYIYRERPQNVTVSRTMSFRKPIDAAKASVTLKDGVLEIILPFAENAKTVKLIPGN